MTLVIVKTVTLSQCGVIWNEITVVAAVLLVLIKGDMLIYSEGGKRIRHF